MGNDAERPGAEHENPVVMRIPASPDYLRLARYAAADAATRAGLGLDGVDDVRLAVSELCTLMSGSGRTIELVFVADERGVEVEGSGAPGHQHDGEDDELARTLVAAVVDEFSFDADGDHARFHILKRREV